MAKHDRSDGMQWLYPNKKMTFMDEERALFELSRDEKMDTVWTNKLAIPPRAINIGQGYIADSDEILATPHASDWGLPHQAAARAVLETQVTPENQGLLRTFHPSLSGVPSVHLVTRSSAPRTSDRFWLVPVSTDLDYTHIAGIEVHRQPSPSIWPRSFNIVAVRDLCGHPLINPRRVLSPDDLAYIKNRFPHAVGCQVRTSGYLVVFYRSEDDADLDGNVLVSCLCAGLIVVAHILDIIPSTQPSLPLPSTKRETLPAGAALQASNGCVALGLRLRMPDGSPVITTVTHGFVNVPRKYPYGKTLSLLSAGLAEWSWRACRRLFYGQPSPCLPLVHNNTRAIDNYNLPLGKPVTLVKNRSVIGTISHTFDTPSSQLFYPAGYQHDLSLVSGDNLPTITPPAGLPQVTGWADLERVLDGAPVFVSAYLVSMWGEGQGWGIHRGEIDHEIVHHYKALVSGMQYQWGNQGANESLSILWRVTGSESSETTGYSGSVLCLGHPKAKECQAVAFQNFNVSDSLRSNGVDKPIVYNGGFVLPKMITECKIDCEPASPAVEETQEYRVDKLRSTYRRSL